MRSLYYKISDFLFNLWYDIFGALLFRREYISTWAVYFTATKSKDAPMELLTIKTCNNWPPHALVHKHRPGSVIHKFYIVNHTQLYRWQNCKKVLAKSDMEV